MSTRSTLGYMDGAGKFRGTYIHHDGFYLDVAADARFKKEGYEALVDWIEAGIAGGGYSGIHDAVPYKDGEGEPGQPISAGEYFDSAWMEFAVVVTPSGVRSLEEQEFSRFLCEKTWGVCVDLAFRELEPESIEEQIRAYRLVQAYVERKWESSPEIVRSVTTRAQQMIEELSVSLPR